jgi:integrase/recombinase XerD
MSDFNDLLFSFKEHLKIKNYSPATIVAYSGRHLLAFFDHLKDNGTTDIKRVSKDLVKDYQQKITEHKENGKGYTTATISVKIRSLKRFFEYLEESGRLLINPAEYIKEPKKERTLPRSILTQDEAKKILDQPNLSMLTGIRDRAVLEVLYSTGVRREELTKLTIYDCDLQGGLLRVNKGKFAKDRVVPLGKHAVKFLKEYITRVRPQHTRKNKQERHLFISQLGTPLSPQVIAIIVRTYAKKAGIKKRVTPHVFRHTFATELVRNGADITAVQKMLGHASLSVTHIYTRVAGVDVKKTHTQSHPREKDKEQKEEAAPDVRMIKGPYRHE